MKFENFKFEHGTVHIRLSINELLLTKKKLYNSVTCLVIKHYHDAFYHILNKLETAEGSEYRF